MGCILFILVEIINNRIQLLRINILCMYIVQIIKNKIQVNL